MKSGSSILDWLPKSVRVWFSATIPERMSFPSSSSFLTRQPCGTTAPEVSIPKTFLKSGVFHLQQLQSIPIVRLQRRIGELTDEELRLIRSKLSELLHLAPPAT